MDRQLELANPIVRKAAPVFPQPESFLVGLYSGKKKLCRWRKNIWIMPNIP
jgi:hypothetical protein